MDTQKSFVAIRGGKVSIAATTTSQRIAIPTAALQCPNIRIVTEGANSVRWAEGDVTVAADATDQKMLVNTVENFGHTISGITHVAAICDTGTCTIEFQFGSGL